MARTEEGQCRATGATPEGEKNGSTDYRYFVIPLATGPKTHPRRPPRARDRPADRRLAPDGKFRILVRTIAAV